MDLIILPFHDWKKNEAEGFRNRDGHLIRHFEKDERINKILVVDRPISLPEMVLKKRPWRIRTGQVVRKSGFTCLTQVSEKIFVLDIFSGDLFRPVVMGRDWWGFIFKHPKTIRRIKENAKFLSIEFPVLFSWSPISSGVVGKIGEKLFVFDADDNWLRHPEMKDKRGFIVSGYNLIREKADVIFTVSEKLKRFFVGCRTKHLYHVPMGVDVEHFRVKTGGKLPDVEKIHKPIIGYTGRLAKRIDVELLSYLAENLPRISFAVAGQSLDRNWMAPLFRYKNIYFLGDKHYTQLPYYLASFDVCIIPHNVGKFENDGDPIKLYEYLAAGKPVVTTLIAGVDVFNEQITIARTKEEFRDGILYWLKRASEEPGLSEKLRASITPEHFWSTKARKMLDAVEILLREKER